MTVWAKPHVAIDNLSRSAFFVYVAKASVEVGVLAVAADSQFDIDRPTTSSGASSCPPVNTARSERRSSGVMSRFRPPPYDRWSMNGGRRVGRIEHIAHYAVLP